MAADYTINTEIDSTKAREGSRDVVKALRDIEKAVKDVKKELLAFTRDISRSTRDVRNDLRLLYDAMRRTPRAAIADLSRSFSGLATSAREAQRVVRQLVTDLARIRVPQINLGITGNLQQITQSFTRLSAFSGPFLVQLRRIDELMERIGTRRITGTPFAFLLRGIEIVTREVNAMRAALDRLSAPNAQQFLQTLAATIDALTASLQAFGRGLAGFRASAADLQSVLQASATALRQFASAASGVGGVMLGLAKGAEGALKPLSKLATEASLLDGSFANVGKAVGVFATLIGQSQGLGNSANKVVDLAAAFELLRSSIKGFSPAAFIKNIDALRTSLADPRVFTDAARAIRTLATSLANLNARGLANSTALSTSILNANTQIYSLARAVNSINFQPLTTLAAGFSQLASGLSSSATNITSLVNSLGKIGSSIQNVPAILKQIDFAPFATNAAAALPVLNALGNELNAIARSVRQIAQGLAQVTGQAAQMRNGLGNSFRDAANLVRSMTALNQQQSQMSRSGGSGQGFLNGLGLRVANAGLRGLEASLRTNSAALHLFASAAAIAAVGVRGLLGAVSLLPSGLNAAHRAAQGLSRIFYGYGSLFIIGPVKQFISSVNEAADAMINMSARLGASSRNQNEARDALQEVFNVSQETRTSFEDTGNAFARFQRTTRSMGTTVKDVADYVASLNAGLIISGATSAETASVVTQLTQAFSKGLLNGDELRAFAENAGILINVLEDSFKKSWGTIREELRTGEMSLDKFFVAIANARPVMEELLKNVPKTMEGALTQLRNQWTYTVGQIAQESGFTDRMVAAVDRFTLKLTSPDVKRALEGIFNAIANIVDGITDAVAGTDNLFLAFDRLVARVAALASAIKALLPFDGETFEGAFSKQMEAFESQVAAANRSPFSNYLSSSERNARRNEFGLDGMREMLGTFEVPIKFNNEEARRNLSALIREMSSELQNADVALDGAVARGAQGLDSFARTRIKQMIEFIDTAADQAAVGKVNPLIAEQFSETVTRLRGEIGRYSAEIAAEMATAEAQLKRLNVAPRYQPADAEQKISSLQASLAAMKAEAEATAKALAALGVNIDFGAFTGAPTSTLPTKDSRSHITPGSRAVEPNIGGRSGASDRIAQLREEISYMQAQMTGSTALTREAKIRLETEKLVTQNIKDRLPAQQKEIEALVRQREEIQEQMETFERFQDLGTQIGDSIVSIFSEVGKGAKSLKDGFKEALASMIELTVQTIILKPLIEAMGQTMGALGSGLGGSPIGGSNGGIGNSIASALASFFTGGSGFSGVVPFAKGDVFSKPMKFGMGNGRMGQMAEAGPEAIMPLRRMSNGSLGVQAAGAMSHAPPLLTASAQTQMAQSATSNVVNNVVFNTHGDMTKETEGRIRQMVRNELGSQRGGIIKEAVGAVAKRHVNNPNYLNRGKG